MVGVTGGPSPAANLFGATRGCDVFKSPQGCSDSHPVGKDECSHPVGNDEGSPGYPSAAKRLGMMEREGEGKADPSLRTASG
ncbi:MAG TPA: hypothetical protein VLV89_12290 [Candidatus Acidoferrum sp.]|nr:hypothetical protein [Candidatus Acidoferrum sp.]